MPYNPDARAEVVAGLILKGGSVTSKGGLAAQVLVAAIESATGRRRESRALSSLLKSMDDDGQIVRTVEGRRTFRIALVLDEHDVLFAAAAALMSSKPTTAMSQVLWSQQQRVELAEQARAKLADERTALEARLRELEKQLSSLEMRMLKAQDQLAAAAVALAG